MEQRNEFYFTSPSFLWPLIKDKRDLPMLHMLWNCVCITVPGAALVYVLSHCLVGALFCAVNMWLFQERFILGQHYFMHRGMFKSKALDTVVMVLLSPFFGLPSGLYHTHHCIMHHCENNRSGWDLSSTEPFQRDNALHFVYYWMRFALMIWIELPAYAWRRKRYALSMRLWFCEFLYFTLIGKLFEWNPTATFWVFLFPVMTNSALLMYGNWCQHMFIDPDNPRSNYGLAYNVIEHPCNQRSFNDGYHIEHHLNSRKHWSKLPRSYEENLQAYKENDAIVFKGLDFFQVGFLVFTRQYDVLEAHLVNFNGHPNVERFLRRRLAPIVNQLQYV